MMTLAVADFRCWVVGPLCLSQETALAPKSIHGVPDTGWVGHFHGPLGQTTSTGLVSPLDYRHDAQLVAHCTKQGIAVDQLSLGAILQAGKAVCLLCSDTHVAPSLFWLLLYIGWLVQISIDMCTKGWVTLPLGQGLHNEREIKIHKHA